MAFNPFSWFRKHQKTLIAVVTILIMFLFILTFGRGDITERFGGIFRRDNTPVVNKIYGTNITTGEVMRTSERRKMVSDFLFGNAGGHSRALNDMLGKELKQAPRAGQFERSEELRAVAGRAQQRQTQDFPMLIQFAQRAPMLFDSQAAKLFQGIRQDLQILARLGADREFLEKYPQLLPVMEKLAAIIGMQRFEIVRVGQVLSRQPVEDLYFGGNSKKTEDTLDFIMWREQAKKLGIELTDGDVAREINREAASEVFAEPEKIDLARDKKVSEFLTRHQYGQAVKVADFVKALREEFAAALAQSVLLGTEPGVRSYRSQLGGSVSPAAVTPEEFYNYFKRNRTTLSAKLLAIPAEKYLAQVKENPTEAELKARYDKYKDREANPAYRDPGFKEPRRIVVQYVTADADDPHFTGAAKTIVEAWSGAGFATRAVASAASAPALPGAGPLAVMANLSAPWAMDPVYPAYTRYATEDPPWLAIEGPDLNLSERDTLQRQSGRLRNASLSSPYVATALLGGCGGPGGLLNGVSCMYGAATPSELKGAEQQALTYLLAAADYPQQTYGALALVLATNPPVQRYAQAYPDLAAVARQRVARELMQAKLEEVNQKITKLRKQPKDVEKYLTEDLVKESPSLKLYTMPSEKTLTALTDDLEKKVDLGLGALLAQFRKEYRLKADKDAAEILFGREMGMFGKHPGAYEPQSLSGFGEGNERAGVLWWRKEDNPARPRDFVDVRDQVVRAWKMDHARMLARDEARKIVHSIDEVKGPVADSLRVMREAQKRLGLGELIELDGVSPLVTPQSTEMLATAEYRPYRLPSDKQSVMKYVLPDLARQLVTVTRPGEAMVIADMPQTTFYVATLEARAEPTLKEFLDLYSRTPNRDTLYQGFVEERSAEYRRSVTDALRAEAGKVGRDGRFEVPEDIRKRETGGDTGE